MTTTPPAGNAPAGNTLARDLPASLVVFLVALPLSLGIALASGAPILAGVIAAVTGGIVVGLLGGAPLQVSGPAAGLTAVVFGLVEQVGGPANWYMVTGLVAAAGVVQIVLGVLGVARYALAMSPAVVHAMLAGIGVLITLGQLQVLLGGAPQSSAIANLKVFPANLANPNLYAAALGIGTSAIIFAWPLLGAKLKRVPPALVAVVLATLASLPLGDRVQRITLAPPAATTTTTVAPAAQPGPGEPAPAATEAAPVVAAAAAAPKQGGTLLDAIHLPKWPGTMSTWDIAVAIMVLAMIASVESLLCAVATDKLHDGPRARLDKELLGQGAANTLSGLLGGLPITGVIVRSKANIDSGALTKWSAILHGVWLLIFVVALGSVVENIPKAVLAGLLVTVGIRLVNLDHIKESIRHGEALPYFVTIGGILVKDLLTGVALGFVVGAVVLLHRLTAVKVTVTNQPQKLDGTKPGVDVTISGALTFRGVPELTAQLAAIPAGVDARVDLDLRFMDHAGYEALHGWQLGHARTGAKVEVDGLDAAWSKGHGPEPEPAPAKQAV